MNILEEFEKSNEIEGHLNILEIGAKHLGADFKISEAFSTEKPRPQFVSLYNKIDMVEEATEAMQWWSSLPQELKDKYDR